MRFYISLAGNSSLLTWVKHSRHSSRKSSATHSYQCVQYFRLLKQWYMAASVWDLYPFRCQRICAADAVSFQRRVSQRDSAIPKRSFCSALVLLSVHEKLEVQQVVLWRLTGRYVIKDVIWCHKGSEGVNAHTDVDACDCTRGLYEHRKRVCLQSGFGRKNPLLQRGFEPESVLLQAFQSDAVPTELLATCSHDWQKALLRHSAFWHLVFRMFSASEEWHSTMYSDYISHRELLFLHLFLDAIVWRLLH